MILPNNRRIASPVLLLRPNHPFRLGRWAARSRATQNGRQAPTAERTTWMIRRATAHTHRNRRSVPLFASYRRRHRREGRHKYLIAFAVVLAGLMLVPLRGAIATALAMLVVGPITGALIHVCSSRRVRSSSPQRCGNCHASPVSAAATDSCHPERSATLRGMTKAYKRKLPGERCSPGSPCSRATHNALRSTD